MGLTASPVDWYAARTAGIVAYLILTGVVLVGLTLAGQVRVPHWPKFAVTDLHRFGGLLVGAFVSIHVATIAIDKFTPFSLTQLRRSAERPVPAALDSRRHRRRRAARRARGDQCAPRPHSVPLVAPNPHPQLRRVGSSDRSRHRGGHRHPLGVDGHDLRGLGLERARSARVALDPESTQRVGRPGTYGRRRSGWARPGARTFGNTSQPGRPPPCRNAAEIQRRLQRIAHAARRRRWGARLDRRGRERHPPCPRPSRPRHPRWRDDHRHGAAAQRSLHRVALQRVDLEFRRVRLRRHLHLQRRKPANGFGVMAHLRPPGFRQPEPQGLEPHLLTSPWGTLGLHTFCAPSMRSKPGRGKEA